MISRSIEVRQFPPMYKLFCMFNPIILVYLRITDGTFGHRSLLISGTILKFSGTITLSKTLYYELFLFLLEYEFLNLKYDYLILYYIPYYMCTFEF